MVLALGALILAASVALVVLAEYVRNLGVRKADGGRMSFLSIRKVSKSFGGAAGGG